MKQLLAHYQFRLIIGLLLADSLFFSFTDPGNVPSFALIIGFLLFAVTLYQLIRGLLRLGKWYGLSLHRHQQRLARVLSGVLSGLVALQSIGQLSPRDVVVLLPLALLAYLYFSYNRSLVPASQP